MKELFLAIQARILSEVTEVSVIDRYRGQYLQQKGTEFPAVYVAFSEAQYTTESYGVQRVEILFTLHIVQQHYEDSRSNSTNQADALAVYDLPDAIYLSLQDYQVDENHTPFDRLSQREVQNNRVDVITVEYHCSFIDTTAYELRDYEQANISPNINLGDG